jgi:hypothetical protein
LRSYSDAGQERWLADHDIDLLRGTGRLAGVGVVEVDGVRHTAGHVVVATGSDPIVPPVPGLRELEGIWTNREVTGMKSVPRRLLVLGGGPVGVEMAQAVRRLGGGVALVESAGNVLSRQPAPLGEALGDVLRRDGTELSLGVARRRANGYSRPRSPSAATFRSTCCGTRSSPSSLLRRLRRRAGSPPRRDHRGGPAGRGGRAMRGDTRRVAGVDQRWLRSGPGSPRATVRQEVRADGRRHVGRSAGA